MRRPARWKLLAWGLPAWAVAAFVVVMAIREQVMSLQVGILVGALALGLAAGAVTAWVGHNRRLARRREAERGGRRGAPDVPLVVERDARGRRVVLAPGAMDARVLVARVHGDLKEIGPAEAP